MKTKQPFNFLMTITLTAASPSFAATANIAVDAAQTGPRIPSNLYGVFLKEITRAGEGGLYAEQIQNRGFEDANLPPACTLKNGFIVLPQTNFTIADVPGLKPQGSVSLLALNNPNEENSFANPQKIVPLKSVLMGIAPSFQHTLPPYSLSIRSVFCDSKPVSYFPDAALK